MSEWNGFKRIRKTRKPHRCACTGTVIPVGASCWQYVGEYEGDFMSWYCTDEAKEFMDKNQKYLDDNGEGYECASVGDLMREMGLLA